MVWQLLLTFCLVLSFACADVREPSTGISFKDSLGGLDLAGVGVRVKKIGPLAVKVYGVGMYLNEKSALADVSDYASKKADSGFFRALRNGASDKKIVLKMARTVGSETMANALAESIKPRMSSDVDAVDTFQEVLLQGLSADGSALKGMEFDFGAAGGKLSVNINGKKVGEVSSKPLCNAFVATYLDDTAVSPTLKDSISEILCGKL